MPKKVSKSTMVSALHQVVRYLPPRTVLEVLVHQYGLCSTLLAFEEFAESCVQSGEYRDLPEKGMIKIRNLMSIAVSTAVDHEL